MTVSEWTTRNEQRLRLADAERVPMFDLGSDAPIACRVVGAYDGDTCTVLFALGGNGRLVRAKMRIAGIDCPEREPRDGRLKPGFSAREDEMAIAALARDALLTHCGTDVLYCICPHGRNSMDAFGRLLGDLFPTHEAAIARRDGLGRRLLELGLAVPYEERRESEAWAAAAARRETVIVENSGYKE